jgi:hypothetical protein
MADVMEERIHSIERTAGFAFVIAAVILGTTMLMHPVFPDVNNTAQVLQSITSAKGEAWMQVHAVMAAGFAIAAIGFCALAFLLHLKGSSGSASVVTACAILGGGIWVTFLSAELYAYRFFANLYGVDAGGATMLFSAVWFWKLGALYAGALFFFAAVFAAGVGAAKRDLLPIWLGWGGALVALVGAMVYIMDFWSTTATGAASQPMQWPAMRYGVGLPLQLWMLGVGVILLREYFSRPMVVKAAYPRPVEHTPRRVAEPASPAATGAGTTEAPHPMPPRIPHPALAPEPEPQQPVKPRIPHPALAPQPEPGPPQQRPGQVTGTDPARKPPPQIFPG